MEKAENPNNAREQRFPGRRGGVPPIGGDGLGSIVGGMMDRFLLKHTISVRQPVLTGTGTEDWLPKYSLARPSPPDKPGSHSSHSASRLPLDGGERRFRFHGCPHNGRSS